MSNRLIFDLLIFTDDATPPMYEGHLIDTDGKKLAQASDRDLFSVAFLLREALARSVGSMQFGSRTERKNA